jgi:predicted nucleotidyltransferase
MNEIIKSQQTKIVEICQQYKVKKIELFGSAAGDNFDPKQSDLDFLVQFQQMPPVEYANNFFGLRTALQNLFNRSIDLVELNSIRNPYFLQAIESKRVVLYAA